MACHLFGRFRWPVLFLALFVAAGCTRSLDDGNEFLRFGDFSIRRISDHAKEVRDGAGRRFVLVDRGHAVPDGFAPHQVVPVPVRRVVAYSGVHIAMLRVLGVLEETLVGVTRDRRYWSLAEVTDGLDSGKIAMIGNPDAVDFERVKAQEPELVMTWDYGATPMYEELAIPCIITTTTEAMDLEARLGFARFLGHFFDRHREAEAYVERVEKAIDRVAAAVEGVEQRPRVIWGDVYAKRVRVEPGNSWVAEMITLAGGDYLMKDIGGGA